MSHTAYIVAGVLAVLWWKGKSKVAQSTQVQDSIPVDGTNFQGDLWARLNGADLTAAGYPNITPGPNASPSKVGYNGIAAGWDGTIGAPA